ncbi:MAG: arginase family protein, partial [Bacteroidota bacterium]
LEASLQVEMHDPDLAQAWKAGLAMLEIPHELATLNQRMRPKAEAIIEAWEAGSSLDAQSDELALINKACQQMNEWVRLQAADLLAAGKIPAVLGGDHSSPLGLMQALAHRYSDFGILQLDAHLDLRGAYEGFIYSHASIMFNALALPQVSKLISVGIRDYCLAEEELLNQQAQRVEAFTWRDLVRAQYQGRNWQQQVNDIVARLPRQVYLSFDIDGLDPALCPGTGTPVPGGLQFEEALYLVDQVVASGREIIGFDLCEVAGEDEWNAVVGARVLYRLYVAAVKSQSQRT